MATTCAVCGEVLRGAVMVRLGEARLVRCAGCAGWIYLPRPAAEAQAAFHDNPAYFEHPYFKNRRQNRAATDRRCRQIFARIGAGVDLAALRGQRLLDVGCDTGDFLLSAARQFGIVPVGVDISRYVVQEAARRDLEVYHADLETAPDHLRDLPIITAIDLIEHLHDPRAFMRQVQARLRQGGVVYLETPNVYSTVYQVGRVLCGLTGGRPRAIFERLYPPEHIQYFSPAGFTRLAQDCGLEVVRIDSRRLPFADLGVSLALRIGLTGLQLLDWFTGDMILACVLLRKP